MDTNGYLDAIKAHNSLKSDYALAKLLGVSTQHVSNWRAKRSTVGPLTAFRIAELLGLNPAVVVADMERERAEKAGNDPQASAWREWVEKLGGVAAAVLVGAVLIGPGPSKASTGAASSSIDSSAYTLSRKKKRTRRLATWLDSLRPSSGWMMGTPLSA